MQELGRVSVDARTHRLVPSRVPPIAAFGSVITAADAEAVKELESWTNDRLVRERLARLPREQWVYSTASSSVVMASFMYAGIQGGRFNGPDLGAWYTACSLKTAVAEAAQHLRREAIYAHKTEFRLQYRQCVSNLAGLYVDIRQQQLDRADLYDVSDNAVSQNFGDGHRAAGEAGIVYDSVIHSGGTNVVAYIPTNIRNVRMSGHFEVIAPVTGKIVARTLTGE